MDEDALARSAQSTDDRTGYVPEELVHALVARSERELAAMYVELEQVVSLAEAAERRVRTTLLGVIEDGDFEACVLAVADRSMAAAGSRTRHRGGVPVAGPGPNGESPDRTTLPPPPPPSATVATPDRRWHEWMSAPSATVDARPLFPTSAGGRSPGRPVAGPRPDAPESTPASRAGATGPPAPGAPPPPPSSSLSRPFPATSLDVTAPVVRAKPRTIVVDRSSPGPDLRTDQQAPGMPAVSPQPDSAPRGASSARRGRWRRARTSHHPALGPGEWLSRIPSRLMIQVGIVIVIASLLVLKLG